MVLIVVSVLLTLVVAGLPSSGLIRGIDADVMRLRAQLSKAADYAVLRGTHVGLALTPVSYRFLAVGADGHWHSIEADGLRGEFIMAPGALQLMVDDRPVPVKRPAPTQHGAADEDNPDKDNHRQIQRPSLIVDDLGEWLPFELRIVRGAKRFSIKGGDGEPVTVDGLVAARAP